MYVRLAANASFDRAVVVVVVAYAVAAVAGVLALAIATGSAGSSDAWTVSHVGSGLSTLVGAALVARGVVALRNSRAAAYHWFLRGLLVWILVTQVFVFYASQLAGLGGLVVDLAAYASLRVALRSETRAGGIAPAARATRTT